MTVPSFKDPFLKSRYPPWAEYYLDYPRLLSILRRADDDDDIQKDSSNGELRRNPKTFVRQMTDITLKVRPKTVASLPEDSVTRVFLDELDDEIDKVTLFVLKQQGQIADKFLELGRFFDKGVFSEAARGDLSDAACLLLNLIKYVQANILAIDKLLAVHDRRGEIKIEHLFLAGKIGRESAMRTTHLVARSRLKVAYRHEGINTLVGLAETVYFKWVTYVRSRRNASLTWDKFHEQTAQTASVTSSEDDPADMEFDHFDALSRHSSLVSLLPSPYQKRNPVVEQHSVQGMFLGIDVALNRLSKSSSFVERWALASGIESADPFVSDEEEPVDTEHMLDSAKSHERLKVSSWLNLANSFLYMVSYYMVAPTSGEYAERLGLSPSMSGAIVGMTAFAALASTVLYSWWTSYSYKDALIFSSLCCLIGNVIYAMGLPFDSLTLVLVGRFLNGFGSARAINRRFIADAFSSADRTAASAAFVASGAAGMSFGPALSAIMPLIVTEGNLWWQEENAPALIVAGLWVVFLVILVRFFHNPPKVKKKIDNRVVEKDSSNGETKILLSNWTTPSLAKETPLWERPVCLVTIFLVFLLKLVLELVLSSAAPIAGHYFGWSPSHTGWYLAIGNGLVLPAVTLVTYLSRHYQDRELILLSQIMMLLGSLILIHYMPTHSSYPVIQYILGTCLLFIAPNTMEGPSMSLLSKNIPKSLTQGLFNLGFFTTEAGFGGRVVADSYLTFCGTWGIDRLVNSLFGSLAIVNAVSLALVYLKFGELVEPRDHYG